MRVTVPGMDLHFNYINIVANNITNSLVFFLSIFQVISVQQKMTDLIHRSQEAGKSVQEAVLFIPSLAIKLTGEAVVNAQAFVIGFKEVRWSICTCNSSSLVARL